ncbi:AraC family transcriptional regulator [Vibrio sinensis]|uniref:AraC family transcriptional regulator n=1 Tax=Vibrio sinensis TaxID=2302434 RepID=A0A3A6QWM5_9VIBR|nr:AraC family transcriptional regulator [Vibrio sinensis]RJX72879.1 AraC family transcriptional regulator [Vibrio sinensis]
MIYREIIDLDDDLFFRAHGAPDQIIRWHYHPQYELHYIRDTNGIVYIGDHVGKFEPGQLVLVGPNLPHNWVSSLPEGVYCRERSWALVFDPELINTIFATFPCGDNQFKLLAQANRGVQFLGNITHIVALMAEFQHQSGLNRVGTFLRLIYEMSEHHERRLLSSNAVLMEPGNVNTQKIDSIIDYINTHSEKQLTLDAIAEEFSITSSSFSRFFKNKTGENFITYLNKLRVAKSCLLLQSTELSIKEIAEQVGFSNPSYFTKIFSEQKSITPKQFRKNWGD